MVVKVAQRGSTAGTEDIQKGMWSLYESPNLFDVIRKAKEMGWEQNKVQVRGEWINGNESMFFIEPYEDGCGCKGLLRYKDFWPQN